jgi:hypothetical protein
MQPRGRKGASASQISLTLPTPAAAGLLRHYPVGTKNAHRSDPRVRVSFGIDPAF